MDQAIQAVFERIYERDGKVTASGVVKEAAKKRSPLHDQFEWDDTLAAKEHRLYQARHLIRKVKITFEGEKSQLVNVPVVKHDDSETAEGEYHPTAVIVRQEDMYTRALVQLVNQISAINKTVDELKTMVEGDEHLSQIGMLITALSTAEALAKGLSH